jgi:hypothetical protein
VVSSLIFDVIYDFKLCVLCIREGMGMGQIQLFVTVHVEVLLIVAGRSGFM